jgi:amidase
MQAANQRTIRFAWQEYFKTRDVFLMPVAFAPAMLKDESDRWRRAKSPRRMAARLHRSGDLGFVPTLAGLPATSAPVGRTRGRLPVGLQIVGPMWEDATPIEFAARLAEVTGGFERPKGY